MNIHPSDWPGLRPGNIISRASQREASLQSELQDLQRNYSESMRYVAGIVERGTGRPLREGATITSQLLEYVRELESAVADRPALLKDLRNANVALRELRRERLADKLNAINAPVALVAGHKAVDLVRNACERAPNMMWVGGVRHALVSRMFGVEPCDAIAICEALDLDSFGPVSNYNPNMPCDI